MFNKLISKSIPILLILLLAAPLTLVPAQAAAPSDAYADAVDPNTGAAVVNPNQAVGAPDGNTATVAGVVGNDLILDMGAGEEGTGDLVVHYGGLTVGVDTTVYFLDSAKKVIDSSPLNMTELGLGIYMTTVAYTSAPTPYRYVRLAAVADLYTIDAVEATTCPTAGKPFMV